MSIISWEASSSYQQTPSFALWTYPDGNWFIRTEYNYPNSQQLVIQPGLGPFVMDPSEVYSCFFRGTSINKTGQPLSGEDYFQIQTTNSDLTSTNNDNIVVPNNLTVIGTNQPQTDNGDINYFQITALGSGTGPISYGTPIALQITNALGTSKNTPSTPVVLGQQLFVDPYLQTLVLDTPTTPIQYNFVILPYTAPPKNPSTWQQIVSAVENYNPGTLAWRFADGLYDRAKQIENDVQTAVHATVKYGIIVGFVFLLLLLLVISRLLL